MNKEIKEHINETQEIFSFKFVTNTSRRDAILEQILKNQIIIMEYLDKIDNKLFVEKKENEIDIIL